MGLTRNQRFGLLAIGTAGTAAVLGRDALLSIFLANAVPATDADENVPPPATDLRQAIDEAVEGYFGRRMATAEDYEISAIGKMQMNGGHCTEQIAVLPGYNTIVPGTMLTTAAHCVLGKDPAELQFFTTYTNARGEEQELHLANDPANPTLVWVNPGYTPDEDGEVSLSMRADDTAIVFYPGVTPPDEITPIRQRVFAYHMAEYNQSVLTTFAATAAGFSGDLPQGKSVDDECEASQELNGNVVRATCKINKGGSGSGLLARNVFGELESLAVLSAVSVKDGEVNISDDGFKSYYAPFYHFQLEGVPFLEKPEQCVKIFEPDGAYLRMQADIGADSVGDALIDGALLRVRDTLDWERAEIGEPNVWLEVLETPDGRDGYIRSDLVVEANCAP